MVLKKRDMKLGIGEINKTIQDCKSMGFDLRMADIMYVFAFQGFKDKNIVYATLFGKGASDLVINEYDSSKKIKFLKKLGEFIQHGYQYGANYDFCYVTSKLALIRGYKEDLASRIFSNMVDK